MQLEATPLFPLCFIYWMALSILALIFLTLALILVKWALRLREPDLTKPSRQGDREAALVDALHLLDAVMEKIWRRLQHLERKQGESRNPGRDWS